MFFSLLGRAWPLVFKVLLTVLFVVQQIKFFGCWRGRVMKKEGKKGKKIQITCIRPRRLIGFFLNTKFTCFGATSGQKLMYLSSVCACPFWPFLLSRVPCTLKLPRLLLSLSYKETRANQSGLRFSCQSKQIPMASYLPQIRCH